MIAFVDDEDIADFHDAGFESLDIVACAGREDEDDYSGDARDLDFVLADATVYRFDPAGFDLLASRFGVMFFADPVVSFANMRKGLKPSGRLAFACWREPRENPWMMAPLQAIYQHVPKLPPQGPEDPGPFAFASEERVTGILTAAGFSEIAMEPCDVALDVAVGQGLDVAAALQLGLDLVDRA